MSVSYFRLKLYCIIPPWDDLLLAHLLGTHSKVTSSHQITLEEYQDEKMLTIRLPRGETKELYNKYL